jgi:DNA-binding NtrC family response regulator
MKFKKDLEGTIKEKVSPLLEQTIERSFGITIPKLEADISDTLKNVTTFLYIPLNTSYPEAKKMFQKEFLRQQLRAHNGNISLLAKFLGVNRRSIHRSIKELSIKVERTNINATFFDKSAPSLEKELEEQINHAIKHTLENYKEIIQPKKMERMYEQLPSLSKDIAKSLPPPIFTWKEAEEEFEKQFLENALKIKKNDIKKTAQEIGLRPETLYRKIKKLKLEKTAQSFL